MNSKRSHEGYLLIDNRCGPGIAEALARGAHLPPGAHRGLFEGPTVTCSHCQRIVVLNPDRQRERAYCPKCDHYLCDGCGAARAASGGECRPYKQVIDEAKEAAARGLLPGLIVAG